MTKPMTSERLAEIDIAIAMFRHTHPGSFGEMVAELRAEVDRLTAQAARFDAEWGVQWGIQRSVYPYENEPAARLAATGHPSHVMRRLVSPWREAPTSE